MLKEKILVAMSGGVDSTVVALKLINAGYEVIGATLNFGKFCDSSIILEAQNIANKLNIKHYIINCEENFNNKVIKYFTNEYLNARTPNPCVKCNREIKFHELLKLREEIKAKYLATGHYANIIFKHNIYYLQKGQDNIKDQSYFLSQLQYENLQYIKFPLGDLEKKKVKEYAKDYGLSEIAEKAESQDICFQKSNEYKIIFKNFQNSGKILHINGKELGYHKGIANYTTGQRKGLNISYSEPLFVIKIDAINNIIYLGEEKFLFKNSFEIDNLNLLLPNIIYDTEYTFHVKVRYSNAENKAKVVFFKNNTAIVELIKSSRNITSGQLCCFYSDDIVVGSGFIRGST